jgi:hypothetical protein
MVERPLERMRSPAYLALRASTRRLLLFVETEIARQGGGAATIFADQFAVVGSVRVILPGLSELQGMGLIDVERHPKKYICKVSHRWRSIATAQQAMSISAVTRVQRVLPLQSAPVNA